MTVVDQKICNSTYECDTVKDYEAVYGKESSIYYVQYTPPRTPRISRLKPQILKPTFLVKYDGEKWSSFFYFEILLAPSELLLPSAERSAQKG